MMGHAVYRQEKIRMMELISKERDEMEANHKGAFTKIYPLNDKPSYDKYIQQAY